MFPALHLGHTNWASLQDGQTFLLRLSPLQPMGTAELPTSFLHPTSTHSFSPGTPRKPLDRYFGSMRTRRTSAPPAKQGLFQLRTRKTHPTSRSPPLTGLLSLPFSMGEIYSLCGLFKRCFLYSRASRALGEIRRSYFMSARGSPF